MRLDLVTYVVPDYDEGIAFFTGVLGFEVAADEPDETNDGQAKRWVVVRPPGGGAGFVLGRAGNAEQEAVIGRQTGGRVAFFLRVEDFDGVLARLEAAEGVSIVSPTRAMPYGRVAVFQDVFGHKWDLLEDV